MICMQRLVKVDGKIRTDPNYPCGFMDVVEMQKAGDQFRLIYDTKGRFVLHRINDEEKKYKLARIKTVGITTKQIPFVVTHDGRTLRYPDPAIKVNDVVKIDIETGKIISFQKFEVGKQVMITKGTNCGRVGVVTHIEKHPGSFDIVSVRDATGSAFSTRLENVFIVGAGEGNTDISLPKAKGISMSILDERDMIMRKRRQTA